MRQGAALRSGGVRLSSESTVPRRKVTPAGAAAVSTYRPMPPEPHPPNADVLLAESAWIAALARSLVADPGSADDVAQDAMIVSLRGAPDGVRSPRAWLRRVVANLASNARRSSARRLSREAAVAVREDAAGARGADEIVARWETRRSVVDAVLSLDEPYRATILARYFDGLTTPEAAARLGVPLETLRTRTRRGLDLLRGRLAHVEDDRGGRGAVAVLWLVGGEAPERRAAAAGGFAALAGGVLMGTTAKWALGAAVAALLGLGVFRSRMDDGDARGGGDVGAAPTTERPPQAPSTGRPRAQPEGSGDGTVGTSGGAAGVDLSACDRERDLHGVVVDAAGNPVAAARVEALENDAYRNRIPDLRLLFEDRVVVATTSAGDGTFALRLARDGAANLRVRADGFAVWESWDRQAGERVRVVLRPAATLVVRVRRADGAPLPGVVVRVLASPREEQMVRAGATTGADGDAVLPGIPRGVKVSLLIEPTGHGSAIQTATTIADAPEQAIDVVVPAGREIRGRIADAATGAPVRGASVGVQYVHLAAVPANDDGTFTYVGFDSKDPSLSVKAPGYAQEIVRVADGSDEVVVLLAPECVATGRILDDGQRPVGGAHVSLFGMTQRDGGMQASIGTATSAADGTFRVSGLHAATPHVLAVRAEGHATHRRELTLDAAPGKEAPLGDIALTAARRVRVVVVDAGGVPSPRQEVTLVTGEFTAAQGLGTGEVRRTDDLGRATFGGVPQGRHVVRLGRDDPGTPVHVGATDPDPVVVTIGGARPQTPGPAAPAAAGELVVTVVDEDGRPVPRAPVQVDCERSAPVGAPTGADGTARVRCASPPERVIVFAGAPWVYDGDGVEVGPSQREVRVVLRRGVPISGHALDADGQPLAGVAVTARSPGDLPAYATPTAADGAFTVHVPPGAAVDIEAAARVAASSPESSGRFALRRGVTPGTEGLELRLTAPTSRAALRVRVVDPAGEPIEGVALLALPLGGRHWLRARTGADGSALIPDAWTVPHTVATFAHESSAAFLAFAAPPSVQAVPGEGDVVMRAFPAAHVRGKVVGPDGAPLVATSVIAQAGAYSATALTDETGAFDVVVREGADLRWRLQVSATLRDGRGGARETPLHGARSTRAPADGIEIRCSAQR